MKLSVLGNKVFSIRGKQSIREHKRLTTLPKMGTSYTINFEVQPKVLIRHCAMVIYFTTASRTILTVKFCQISTRKKVTRLIVCDYMDRCHNSPKNVRVGQWASVAVKQYQEGVFFRHDVTINDTLIKSILYHDAREMNTIQVFVGSPWKNWKNCAYAYIRDLFIVPQKGTIYFFQMQKL